MGDQHARPKEEEDKHCLLKKYNALNCLKTARLQRIKKMLAEDSALFVFQYKKYFHFLEIGRHWIHDNLCDLTIKSDTGQHSQFLRCFPKAAKLIWGLHIFECMISWYFIFAAAIVLTIVALCTLHCRVYSGQPWEWTFVFWTWYTKQGMRGIFRAHQCVCIFPIWMYDIMPHYSAGQPWEWTFVFWTWYTILGNGRYI